MHEGFAVQPDKLKKFQGEAAKIAANYETINVQLGEAQLTNLDQLLGTPDKLGHSGPPVDFTNASEAMLTNLATILETLQRLHVAIGTQFTHMEKALGETHDLYLKVDGDRAGVFDGLLGDLAPDGS